MVADDDAGSMGAEVLFFLRGGNMEGDGGGETHCICEGEGGEVLGAAVVEDVAGGEREAEEEGEKGAVGCAEEEGEVGG